MASSSTSSVPKSFKYDVFLSFRGEDTRKSFVDHLYHALEGENIETYKDDEKMVKGERICDELINAIEDSRFYIIVFSKDYASSSWCLDELVKIMECQGTTEQKAYPVFYDVEPTEVRKQSGAVGEAFARRRMDEDAGKWRKALEEAAGLAGFGLKNTANGHEAQFIQEIVKVISHELNSISFMVDEKLVGMETRIKGIISSLELGFVDVRMLGIKGMGGGGKTTLARAVFDQISHQFEGKSFVENVREVSKSSLSGLKSLQEKILSNVLGKQIVVNDVHDGKKMMKRKLCGRKVLVVLDDVDLLEQLEALAGESNWFKSGSRIIITTRDEQVLIAHEVTSIRDVNLLSNEEAICLFNRIAFRIGEIPSPRFKELSQQVVRYAAGLPLTIRVLGSDLKGKEEDEWKDTLESLKKIPLQKTLQKLELSYMGLERDHKDIFLDVACFWKGEEKDFAIRALECCQLHAKAGLSVLEKKSLITVSEYGRLKMHDSIQEMGWDIVRRDHRDEPQSRSRLWDAMEIENILANDLASEAIRGIKLWSGQLNPSIIMKGLKNMKKLRFLHVCDESAFFMDYNDGSHRDRKNDEVSRNLVQLWEGGEKKVLPKLRFFELSRSRLKTLDLGLTPDLDTLHITYCHSFKKLHMSAKCLKLKSLDISGSKLTTLDLKGTPNLETLRLRNCFDLVELQNLATCLKLKSIDMEHMKELTILNLEGTPNLETNFEGTQNLETLRLDSCSHLVEVQMPTKCRNLKFLHINDSKLTTLDFEGALNLESLNLVECFDLVEVQMPTECPKLKTLNLSLLKLKTLRLRTPNLESLNLEKCFDLVVLYMLDECPKLTYLSLRHSMLRTFNLMQTPNLELLDLKGCYNLVKLDAPIGCLKKITRLCLSGCSRFENFGFFKKSSFSSRELKLIVKSIDICPLHPDDSNLPKFQFECRYDEGGPSLIGNLEKLISVDLCACPKLESFYESICDLRDLRKLTLIGDIPEVPKDLGRLGSLEELMLSSTQIKHLPDSICMLLCLKFLILESCHLLEKLPEDLGQLGSLEELILSCTKIKHLPDSICMLQHLKFLKLESCHLLEKLPKDLGRLECLEQLCLWDCKSLQDIPDNICKMKRLESLCLHGCIAVEKLPEELGSLENLKELDVQGTHIRHLPQNIVQSCSLTSQIHTSRYEAFYYRGTHSRCLLDHAPPTTRVSFTMPDTYMNIYGRKKYYILK